MERQNQHGLIDRRSFLDGAGRFALGGLMVGTIFETMRRNSVWGQQVANGTSQTATPATTCHRRRSSA